MKTAPNSVMTDSLKPARRRAGEAWMKVFMNRLVLLCRLAQGEFCVSALEADLGIRQPTLSQQLGVLRTEGVVATRREGKQIFYSLSDPHIENLLQTLYNLYCCENCQS